MDQPTKYPIGIQTFSKIREENFLYVDKTRLVYRLVTDGQYYFLSRPRRFGKSLLLSTIKSYFEGRKDLFKGLAIEELERDWRKHPVLLLSLSNYNLNTENSLENIIIEHLREWEEEYNIIDVSPDLSMRLRRVIREAYNKNKEKVVILIDEYDAPIVAHIENDDKKEKAREILKSVYANLKEMDQFIRFAMVAGVSRFSKMTIFSGLNNILDISLDDRYSEICGITSEELVSYFKKGISSMAEKLFTDFDGVVGILKENYDGYHFTENSVDIYNPFSLMIALEKRKIAPYWFQSATPSFLVKLLQNENEPLYRLLKENVNETFISEIDAYQQSPLALLFQTGYLTIKKYDERRGLYSLGLPNKEVETGLFMELLADNTGLPKYKIDSQIWNIRDAFDSGKPDLALSLIKSFLAGIPAVVTQNKPEIYYENNLFMLLRLIGTDVETEKWTSDGRIDILLKTQKFIYVMELKLDSTPNKALEQIEDKDYTLPWRYNDKRIFKIGVNFSSKSRNIENYIIKEEARR